METPEVGARLQADGESLLCYVLVLLGFKNKFVRIIIIALRIYTSILITSMQVGSRRGACIL